MSAKQRHKQRAMKRLTEKLENVTAMEETLHSVVKQHVSKAEKRCAEVLGIEDTGVFLLQYGKIEQDLDGVLNFLELLTSSAEDMIENAGHESPEEEVLCHDKTLVQGHVDGERDNPPTSQSNLCIKEHIALSHLGKHDISLSAKRLVSDKDIEKELKEMIQSSSRRRHSSAEAASQTVLADMAINHSDKVCKTGNEEQMSKRNIYTPHTVQVSSTDEMCKAGYVEQNTKCNIYTPCTVQVANADEDFKGHSFDLDNTASIIQTVTEKNLMDINQGKKIPRSFSSKSEKKSKTEKGVPERVKMHLGKEPSPSSDDSGSSNLDSLTFGEDVKLASSPKGKQISPNKKRTPKKESKKSDRENVTSQLEIEVSKTDLPVKEVIDENTANDKQKIDEFRETDVGISSKNTKLVLSDQNEMSSEPTINSSEQSILEHELTEMMATTESNETSSSSGIRYLSVKDGQVVTYSEEASSAVTCKQESLSNQKSLKSSNNVELKNDKSVDIKGPDTVNIGPHKHDKQARNSSSGPLKCDNQGSKLNIEISCDTAGVESVQTNSAGLSPGSLLQGRITPVIVSEVVSPWCFFVQQNGTQLNELMEQICMYMLQCGLNSPPLLEPEVGTLCLARYSKDTAFYRAYVTQIHRAIQKHATEVDVLYVDYGNRERVKVTQLRTLPEKFKTLPTQAICCALAEVMPCNKYCVWAEEDIHIFRQYVTGQQLSCTPPTCRSSSVCHPLLVELIVSLPVPAGLQGGIYLSQFSIAQLLVKNNKARHVEVTDQLTLLVKSQEGAEEAAILSRNDSATTRLAIQELSESLHDPPADVTENTQCEPSKHDTVTEESLEKNDHENPKELEEKRKKMPDVEQLNFDKETDISSIDVISSDNKPKQGGTNLISPRSENSDTESQKDEGLRGSYKTVEKGQSDSQGTGSRGLLHKIKEEKMDLESCETASTSNSATTDFDFPPGKGIHLSDLHFDLDDLYLNPQGQEVMLAHVKSPDEFFVHIISQQSGETLDRLMKNLNSLFETANRRKLTRLSKTFDVAENKLCCAQFLQDNSFYRGIIRSTTPEKEIMKGRVLVHYVDFGDEEWLPKRRIFPLPSQFCNVPRLALRCSLAYIKPLSQEGEPVRWSEKSIEKFVNIAGLEKTLQMHVVQGSLVDLRKGDPCVDPPVLGVLLVDNTGTEEVCVNMDLINEGVAKLDPDQAKPGRDSTCEMSPETRLEKWKPLSPEINLDMWNPMEEDFFSKRNSYKVDIDDAGVATTGYKARDEERICKYFSMGKQCWRGEQCPYRHILVESGVTYDQEPVYAILDNQADILPSPGSWVAIEISTILSPSHFYAILPLGNKSLDTSRSEPEKSESAFGETGSEETLDDLLQALNTEYSRLPAYEGDLLLRAIGEIVAARFSVDKNWYRAKVIEVTEEKVKVFYVDFGNTEWLSEDEIVDIKPEFLHLPFQAVECFMHLEPKGEKWIKDARIEFRHLVDGKMLVAHIKSRSWNGCLWVELYDTTTDEDVNVGEELVKRGHALKAESQDSHTDYSSSMSCPTRDILLVPG